MDLLIMILLFALLVVAILVTIALLVFWCNLVTRVVRWIGEPPSLK